MKYIENTQKYWENRYQLGGTSGAGSYGMLSQYKAGILNRFVKENDIHTVLELGCGDGNQLALANYERYIGIDISETAVALCKRRFNEDSSKSFYAYDGIISGQNVLEYRSELTLSLDVIYHLIEDNIFEQYMKTLFLLSKKYVIIYSSDFDHRPEWNSAHIYHRKFSTFVEKYLINWSLKAIIKNPYPYNESDSMGTTWSNFFIYEKIC